MRRDVRGHVRDPRAPGRLVDDPREGRTTDALLAVRQEGG